MGHRRARIQGGLHKGSIGGSDVWQEARPYKGPHMGTPHRSQAYKEVPAPIRGGKGAKGGPIGAIRTGPHGGAIGTLEVVTWAPVRYSEWLYGEGGVSHGGHVGQVI